VPSTRYTKKVINICFGLHVVIVVEGHPIVAARAAAAEAAATDSPATLQKSHNKQVLRRQSLSPSIEISEENATILLMTLSDIHACTHHV
jgi:hypothetical protein